MKQFGVTPTNSSQSDTLQVKSHILVKQTSWWYILGQLKLGYLKQLRYKLRFYIIFLLRILLNVVVLKYSMD